MLTHGQVSGILLLAFVWILLDVAGFSLRSPAPHALVKFQSARRFGWLCVFAMLALFIYSTR